MGSNPRSILVAVAGPAILSILLSACAPGVDPTESTTTQVGEPSGQEPEEDAEEHEPNEHLAGAHDVPDDAAGLPNPFAGDEESAATGANIYAASCAICHGEGGGGDGPAASGLVIAPADLHEGHVQENTDGGLFYIISHGKPETPMPAFSDLLDEDGRWHVVNFLRTFQEE